MSNESCTALPVNGFVLPSNEAIASALLARFQNFIIGTTFKIGQTYRLNPEDRDDMRHEVFAKFLSIDWRTVFRDNKLWIKHNVDHPSRNWTAEEAAFVLKSYAKITALNTLLWSAYYTKNHGMTGLGGNGNIFEIPQAEIYGPTESQDTDEDSHEIPHVEPSADGQADRTAAKQMCEIAKGILDPQEWNCLQLQFGFDGGGNRTLTQVARDAHLPRKRTQELLDSAMTKLKTHVNR